MTPTSNRMPDPRPSGSQTPSSALRLGILAAALLALAGMMIVALRSGMGGLAREWLSSLGELGFLGGVLFVVVFSVSTVVLTPGSLFMTASGAAFGLTAGTGAAIAGATIGSALAFLVGRYLARERVERWTQKHPNFAAVERAISVRGWRIVALTRCCPLLPYIFQNYAYGLTRIRFDQYVWGSFLGLIPSALIFSYLGSLTRAGVVASTGPDTVVWLDWVAKGLGFAATIALSIWISRAARRALHDAGVEGV